MKNKLLVTTIVYFLLNLSLYSQSIISGKVVDSLGIPLELCNVVLKDINNQIVNGTITNDAGNFTFSNIRNAKYTLTISYVGFQDWEKEINVDKNCDLENIILIGETTLDEINLVVKKEIFTQEKDKIIFQVQNSPLKNGYEISDLLKVTPFVWMTDENITIQGDKATLMVNGKKVDFTYFSDIRSEDISKIEVQTHQSANDEASTTGGIINIILKKKEMGVTSRITSYYNYKPKGYNFFSGLNLNYGTEKWNLYSSYNYGKHNIYEEILNEVTFLTTEQNIETNSQKWKYSNNHNYKIGWVNQLNRQHQIGFEMYGNFSTNKNTSFGNIDVFDNNTSLDSGTLDIYGNGNNQNVAGDINYQWNKSDSEKIKVYVDYFSQKTTDFNYNKTLYNDGNYTDNEYQYDSDAKMKVIALQTDYSKTFDNKTHLETGIKFTKSNRFSNLQTFYKENTAFIEDPDKTSDINYREDIGAFFVSADQKIQEKNFIKIGLRTEITLINKTNLVTNQKPHQSYTNLFPSFSFSRNISDKRTLSITYSRSLQRPNFGLLNNEIRKVNDFQYYIGNPNLAPEFVQKYQINYKFDSHILSAYYKRTKNILSEIYEIENDIAYYKTVNLGTEIRYGIDYSYTHILKKWWFFKLSTFIYNDAYSGEPNKASEHLKTTYGGSIYTNFKIDKTTNFDISAFYRSPSEQIYYRDFETYGLDCSFKKIMLKEKLNLKIDFVDLFNTVGYKNKREFETFTAYYERKPNRNAIKVQLTYNFSNHKKVATKQNESKNEIEYRL